MNNSTHSVLIISYYWPPAGGSGVQRWMYFAKHLKQLGWNPHIITVIPEKASYAVLDYSLENEVVNIPVSRTQTSEPLQWYSLFTTASKRKGIPQGEVNTNGLLKKFAAFIRGNFFIPDARKGWRYFALDQAKKIFKENSFSHVITTGPPHSAHWIGNQLKKEFSIQWIADFRDPWTTVFYNSNMYRMSWAKEKDLEEEASILLNADRILTTVGGAFHEELKSKAPKQNFYAIPNGYDSDLFRNIPKTSLTDFHIVYTGLLTENQAYTSLVKALKKFQNLYRIQLSLAGQIAHKTIEYFRTELPKIRIIYHGYLPHHKAVALMKSGDLLLNFIFKGADKTMISGKLLEYIATGVPILSIGEPESEVAHFLQKGTAALMAKPNQNKIIEECIHKAILQRGKWVNHFPELEEWSRKALTKKLIQILESSY